jgi:RNA recognition motif-containing protein
MSQIEKPSWADESEEFTNQQQVQADTKPAWKSWNSKSENKKDNNQYDSEYPAPGLEKVKREETRNVEFQQPNERREKQYYNNYKEENRRDENYKGRDNNPHSTRNQRQVYPLPKNPPFIAFVGNLSFNLSEDELHSFFEDNNCKPLNIRYIRDKETKRNKGFGYVEFSDLKGLENAISLNGTLLAERNIKVDVANQDHDSARSSYRSHNSPELNNFEKVPEEKQEEQKERKKLELKPRSISSNEPVGPDYTVAKSNPFGEAKPRDENLFLKKIEEKKVVNLDKQSPKLEEKKVVNLDKQSSKLEEKKAVNLDKQSSKLEEKDEKKFNNKERFPKSDNIKKTSERRDERLKRDSDYTRRNDNRDDKQKRIPVKRDYKSNDNKNKFKNDESQSIQIQNKNIFSNLPVDE